MFSPLTRNTHNWQTKINVNFNCCLYKTLNYSATFTHLAGYELFLLVELFTGREPKSAGICIHHLCSSYVQFRMRNCQIQTILNRYEKMLSF